MAVRPEGANHRWGKNPPGELSIDPVADERLMRVTAWAGANSIDVGTRTWVKETTRPSRVLWSRRYGCISRKVRRQGRIDPDPRSCYPLVIILFCE